MGTEIMNKLVNMVTVLPLEDVGVPEYQRVLSTKWATRIAKEFDPLAFDFPLVGRRQNGTLWLIDGQTRFAALKLKGMQTCACRVIETEGVEHEALLFRKINKTRRTMKCYDVYIACRVAKEKDTVEIDNELNKHELKVAYSGGWPYIKAVAKLYEAHEDGVLPQVLHCLRHAWYQNPDALREVVIGGLWKFWTTWPEADIKRCIAKWKGVQPSSYIMSADAAKAAGGSRYMAYANGLKERYNANLKSPKRRLYSKDTNRQTGER